MIRLAVRVAREHAELVTAELLALSPAGIEEREIDAATVELAIYGAPGELPELPAVRAAAGDALLDVTASALPDDWERRWRDWHRPIDAGPLRIRPPWAPARPGALDVVIDPGQAFGTGSHPSTRLALELLLDLPPQGALADWGCGSGVLAVAAARLGFDPVHACDVDERSLEATNTAAAANRVAIAVTRIDLRQQPGPSAPTVVANLVRRLLLAVAAVMELSPERLIASGLQPEEVDELAAAFARHGLGPAARRDGDGWSAIMLAQ